MKQVVIILFCALSILARGGDTLKYSSEVNSLQDGDVFYAEKHWKSLKDSIQKVINGRLGNKNIATDAAISINKIDTIGTLKIDTLKAKRAAIDTFNIDTCKTIKSEIDTANINDLKKLRLSENKYVSVQSLTELNSLINIIGLAQTTIIIIDTISFTSNDTIPANISLEFKGKGCINVSSGDTVWIGNMDCDPLRQIYTGSGLVKFLEGSVSYVRPEQFGAKRDSITNDQPAIQKCIESLKDIGGEILLNNGKYAIGTDILIKYSNIKLIGKSMFGTVLKWIGGASGSSEIVYINKSTYNSGSSYEGIHVKNLMLDGNNKAYLGIYANGVTSDCVFENIRITQCCGFLWAMDCWYSAWRNILAWAHVDGLPDGALLADWKSMHNSSYKAPITFTNANSTTIIGLHCSGFGTTNIPATGAITTHLIYLTGYNTNIKDLSIENSNGYAGGSISFDRLITHGTGSNHLIDELYIEKVVGNYGIDVSSNFYRDLKLSRISLQNTSFEDKFIYSSKQPSIDIDGIAAFNSKIRQSSTNSPCILYNAGASETNIKNILWEPDTIITVSGADYVNLDDFDMGPITARGNYSYPYTQLPQVKSGCSVSKYTSVGVDYVLVTGGALNVDRWKVIPVGRYNSTSNSITGFKFRPKQVATNWNVCADFFGCVFLEKQDSVRLDVGIGKLILATFTTDAGGLITAGPTAVTNTLRGEQINSITNKRIYRADLPTTGAWTVGDIIINTTPTSGVYQWVCSASGDYSATPPVWEQFGRVFDKTLTAPVVNSDTLKVGLTGSVLSNISIIDGTNDTLSITSGGKTWKLLPVANQ